jgi:short-subunit dehydrogenase
MKLQGKVAVVTGASMGIGEAIARVFAAAGGSVVLSSRDQLRAEAARSRIGHSDRTLAVACDVRKRGELEALLAATLARFGRVDIWVNNAGFGLMDSVEHMDMRACRDLFETNLFGTIEGMQVVTPVMKRQGSGAIVNISSVSGHIASPFMAAYSASKHAMNAIGHAARLELRGSGVNVITVCPGYITTDFGQNAMRAADAQRIGASARYSVPPDRVAQSVVRAYLSGARHVVVPWWYWIPIKLYEHFPTFVEWTMRRSLRPADQVIAAQRAKR